MCVNENGNRELVCTVGNLTPGQQYRTPAQPAGWGESLMVTDATQKVAGVTVVNICTGALTLVSPDTRLGRDRQGRLYASRYLNPTPTPTAADEEIDLSEPPLPNHTTMGDI